MTYELCVDAYLNQVWLPLPVRYGGPGGRAVNIQRGRKGDSSGLNVSQASFVIDNRDGDWSPRNVLGPNFGYLKRNTPVRVYTKPHNTTGDTIDIVDTFTRSVTGGWGAASPGGTYLHFGSGGSVLTTDFDVISNQAKHYVPVANGYRASYQEQAILDGEQTIDLIMPLATGGDLQAGLMFRGTSLTNYIHMRVHFEATTNNIFVRIYSAAGVELGVYSTGLTHAGTGTPLRFSGKVVGQYYYAKIYPTASLDPGWQLIVKDSARPIRGWVGIRSGRASANTNTTNPQFSYDNYSVVPEEPRFFGEIPSWPVESDGTGVNVTSPLEGAGITRRLTQGRKPLRSAAYTAVMSISNPPIAYWTLEDTPEATYAKSEITGVADLTTSSTSQFTAPGTGAKLPPPGAPKFGAGQGMAGSRPVLSLAEGGLVSGGIPVTTTPTTFEVQFGATFEINAFNPLGMAEVIGIESTGTLDYWDVTFGENLVQFSGYSGGRLGSFVGTASAAFNPYDGAPHHYAVYAQQNGADVIAAVVIDGVLMDTSNLLTSTLGQPTRVTLNILEETGNHLPSSLGHLAIYTPRLSTDEVEGLVDAYHGYLGETAADRIERLGAQCSVSVSIIGTNADTTPMGPQLYGKTFLEYVTECVNTDGGLLLEPNSFLGYLYRTRSDLIGQSSVCDFLYGDFMDFPKPLPDDFGVQNLVDVTNFNGDTVSFEDTDGPLGTAAPEDGGIGIYDNQISVNVLPGVSLGNIAAWNVNRTTGDDMRFDALRIGLHKSEFTSDQTKLDSAIAIDTDGNVITLTGFPTTIDSSDEIISLLTLGITEDIDQFEHYISINTLPVGVWQGATFDDGVSKYDSSHSFTNESFDAGVETGLDVEIRDGGALWVTGSGAPEFPIEITLYDGGIPLVELNVTAISGTSSPQTFTVDATTLNGYVGLVGTGLQVKLRNPSKYVY